MTPKQQVDLFLETYRRLEAVANRVLPKDTRSGAIARLQRLPQMAPYREELDCCREARNLLTHEVRVEGDPPIIPSEGMQLFLEKIIQILEDPVRVKDRMTPRHKLVTVSMDEPLLPILKIMEEKGLSRIPLIRQNGVVEGMLSIDTIFSAVANGFVFSEDTMVSQLAPYLTFDRGGISSYRFVAPEMTLDTAEDLFHRMGDKRSKLRALLVTETGSPNAPLVGVLSPYDVLNASVKKTHPAVQRHGRK